MFIKSEFRIVKVNFEDILFLEGLKDYTKVYVKGKPKPVLTLQSLKYYEEYLDKTRFIRVHRSFIVSIGQIEVISKNVITIGEYSVPVSDSCRKALYAIVHENS